MRPLLVVNGRIPYAGPPPETYVPGDRIVFLKTLQEGAITQILRMKDGAARYAIVRFDCGEKLIAAFRELRPRAAEAAYVSGVARGGEAG